jgi:hypothetical protein
LFKKSIPFIFGSMQPSANYYPPLGPSDVESESVFNGLIVYEDFETGKQAKRTFDFLAEQLKDQCQFTTQMWKFDVLNIPKLREMAAKDAGSADIVIISCHGRSELPPEVRAWIELWLAEKNHAIALVALVNTEPGLTVETNSLQKYLGDVALRGGMEFFAQPDELMQTVRSPQPPSSYRISPPPTLEVASLAQAVGREGVFPRWGINE